MSYFREVFFLGYMHKRKKITPNFSQHIQKLYLKRFIFCCCAFFIPRKFNFASEKTRKRYIVYGPAKARLNTKGFDQEVLTLGPPSLMNNNFSIHKLFIYLYLYLNVSKYFVKGLRREILILRETIKGAELLILNSDGLPLARAILLATCGISIKSVCIQHGVFHNYLGSEIDGSRCDINIILNRTQKKFFDEAKINNYSIYSEIKLKNEHKEETPNKNLSKIAVLIGEGMNSEHKEKHKKLLNEFKILTKDLKKKGWRVKYRAHPNERKNIFFHISILFYLKVLPSFTLDKKNSYIGDKSTLLTALFFKGFEVYNIGSGANGIKYLPEVNKLTSRRYNYDTYNTNQNLKLNFLVVEKFNFGRILDAINK